MLPEVRFVSERDLDDHRGPQLLRWLLAHGADEFSITVTALQDTHAPFADAFEDELAPFERPTGPRRVVGSAGARDTSRVVRLWTFDDASLERLLSFLDGNIFHCPPGPDGWLEDLTIYRRGELVLGVASAEREGVLRLTAGELAEVAALDIPFERAAEYIEF